MSDRDNKKLGDIIPEKIKNIQVPTNPFNKNKEEESTPSTSSKKKNLDDTTELPNLEAEIESGAAERYAEEHAGERAANMLRNHEVSEDNSLADEDYQDGEEDIYSEPTIMFNPVDGSSYVNPDYAQEEEDPASQSTQFRRQSTRPAPQYSPYPPQSSQAPNHSSNNKPLLGVMVAIIVLLIVAIIAVIVFGISNHKQSDTTTSPEITMSTTVPTEPSTIYETTRYRTTTTRPTTWTTTTREATTEDNSFHTDRNGNATWSTRASVEEITPE